MLTALQLQVASRRRPAAPRLPAMSDIDPVLRPLRSSRVVSTKPSSVRFVERWNGGFSSNTQPLGGGARARLDPGYRPRTSAFGAEELAFAGS